MKKSVIRRNRREKGQAFVEYVILIAVVALAALFVLANFSDRLGEMVTGITKTLGGEAETTNSKEIVRNLNADGAEME